MKILFTPLILAGFLSGCSGERTDKQEINRTGESVQRSVNQFGDDVRQEVCEMVEGKLVCAAERVKRDISEATN
jgi:PBP1b-binding outer membrane lipoprotein LpoB